MAAFVKFEAFSEALAKGEHNCHTDTFKVYLTNTVPSAAADTVKADLAESMTTANGYTVGGEDATNTVSRSGGTTSVVGVDIVWTASGAVGPFQYAVLYNDTHASDALIGYWDYASAVTLANGETFTADFGSSLFTLA
jgi:hypothetical protein